MSNRFTRILLTAASLTFAVSSQPVAAQGFIATDTTVCVGSCIDYTALTSNAITWDWLFIGGTPLTFSGPNPTGICYNTAGNYTTYLVTFDGTNIDTVIYTDYITVGACTPPQADFYASQTTFCERGCISFFDSSAGNPTQWTWRFPGASPIVSSNQRNPIGICYPVSGFYDVLLVVQNADGIDSLRKTAYINVESCPLPVADFAASTVTACSNTCISFSDLSLYTDTSTVRSWYFPGAEAGADTSSAQNPSCVTYPQDGLYDVRLIVSNQYGSDTLTLYSYIRIESNPLATVGPDTTMFYGNPYQLTATGGVSFQWTAEDTTEMSSTIIPDPIVTPTNTTTYTCYITDATGCTAIRQVTVTVLHNDNFFVPTAFSPNGDGQNDVLYFRGTNIRRIRFSVFDRYGKCMFESEDPAVGWDGKYQGKELNSGVFTWVATMLFENSKTVTESGTTTLIR